MPKTFKRAAAAGFTLIELLIVVIILAILAAIAIPQFSATSADAQQAALDANLATVRNSLEQYRAQHTGNVYPGANATDGGTCSATKGKGTAGTLLAFQEQLSMPSDAAGNTCSLADNTYRYGPYLRQGIPVQPIDNKADVAFTNTGAAIVADDTTGWAFDAKSGQFIMNSTKKDPNDKLYAAH
jgi:prepilin-type N-terminal cleavage/methylation domain-containing protein